MYDLVIVSVTANKWLGTITFTKIVLHEECNHDKILSLIT